MSGQRPVPGHWKNVSSVRAERVVHRMKWYFFSLRSCSVCPRAETRDFGHAHAHRATFTSRRHVLLFVASSPCLPSTGLCPLLTTFLSVTQCVGESRRLQKMHAADDRAVNSAGQ
jgi:hypothetical protein